jgi:hypothetical protein
MAKAKEWWWIISDAPPSNRLFANSVVSSYQYYSQRLIWIGRTFRVCLKITYFTQFKVLSEEFNPQNTMCIP